MAEIALESRNLHLKLQKLAVTPWTGLLDSRLRKVAIPSHTHHGCFIHAQKGGGQAPRMLWGIPFLTAWGGNPTFTHRVPDIQFHLLHYQSLNLNLTLILTLTLTVSLNLQMLFTLLNHTDPNGNNKTIKTQLFSTDKSNTLHLNYTGRKDFRFGAAMIFWGWKG